MKLMKFCVHACELPPVQDPDPLVLVAPFSGPEAKINSLIKIKLQNRGHYIEPTLEKNGKKDCEKQVVPIFFWTPNTKNYWPSYIIIFPPKATVAASSGQNPFLAGKSPDKYTNN